MTCDGDPIFYDVVQYMNIYVTLLLSTVITG